MADSICTDEARQTGGAAEVCRCPKGTRSHGRRAKQRPTTRLRRVVPVRGRKIKAATITTPYHPPIKRSVTIAGHETSVSLEPVFWSQLELQAGREGLPLSALVARVDAERLTSITPPNLASALRAFVLQIVLNSVDAANSSQ